MADDRTVLEHLLDGREALQREVERLTAAIAELDAVISHIGGAGRRVAPAIGVEPDGDALGSRDVEPLQTGRGLAKRANLGRSADTGEPPKSIRIRVLEMLAAEDRDFTLAEIIDRVHDAGIQAHDDAVRSITIKLMKDGSVERVGRGQYRLARPGAAPADAAVAVLPEPIDEQVTGEDEFGSESDDEPTESREAYMPPLNLGEPWEPTA
jgi:predicted transcriptional regulator